MRELEREYMERQRCQEEERRGPEAVASLERVGRGGKFRKSGGGDTPWLQDQLRRRREVEEREVKEREAPSGMLEGKLSSLALGVAGGDGKQEEVDRRVPSWLEDSGEEESGEERRGGLHPQLGREQEGGSDWNTADRPLSSTPRREQTSGLGFTPSPPLHQSL